MNLMLLYPEYREIKQEQQKSTIENKIFEINKKLKPVPVYVEEIVNNINK